MSGHEHNSTQYSQNQGNQMSDNPADGNRNSKTLGKDGREPFNRAPDADQGKEAIDAFGGKGADR